ncbi:MAG: hypothetical protein AMJ79_15300 [Phycisphaerae bacterium SM23_30]|nr:MAG: hypothetical protein AMJ79_15300 [Phycisphaerae bacterium SM23_30]
MPKRIIILDTPAKNLEALGDAFMEASGEQCTLHWVYSADRLKEKLRTGLDWDILVLDCVLGDGHQNGLELLSGIRDEWPGLPVVVVAEQGDVDIAHQAIQAGANDFLVRSGKLVDRVSTLLKKVRPHLALIDHNRMLREQNMLLREAAGQRYQIVGESPQIMEIFEKIERVAQIPRPVLIMGERGTGKELVARAIHRAGGDARRPMVVVNCAAFPDNLLETELFGHEKGAFTGADHQTHGKFELASGGTLFLDEIGNMSLSFQQKILRVVEYGTFTRVGGSAEIRVDTRIIAATNVDLNQKISEGEFLQDLYDRLSFEVIEVPPLRERQGDVDLLARHFLNTFMQEIPSLGGKRLNQSALKVLRGYTFPGNVRELKNIIERAAYRDTTSEITPEDLGMLSGEPSLAEGDNFNEKIDAFKMRLITEALASANGNQAQAARKLGLSYHQYRYFLRKYELKELYPRNSQIL